MAFEELSITHSDLNANINNFHFKPKILEAIDHLKDISHKRPDVDSTFGFITRKTGPHITRDLFIFILFKLYFTSDKT